MVTTGSVCAQEQRHQRGMQTSPVVDKVIRAVRRLELTEEQKASTRVILDEMKTDIRPIMAEMKTTKGQLKELISADLFDEEAVAAVADKEGDLTAERVMITSRALSQILAQLTDEQRAELEVMAAGRHDKQRQKRAGKPRSPSDEG